MAASVYRHTPVFQYLAETNSWFRSCDHRLGLEKSSTLLVLTLPFIFQSLKKGDYSYCVAGIYLLEVNNENTRTMREICSKFKIKIPDNRFHTFFYHFLLVHLEQINAGWLNRFIAEHNRQTIGFNSFLKFQFFRSSFSRILYYV